LTSDSQDEYLWPLKPILIKFDEPEI